MRWWKASSPDFIHIQFRAFLRYLSIYPKGGDYEDNTTYRGNFIFTFIYGMLVGKLDCSR